MKYSKEDKAEALATLRKLCPPGTTVYTKLNHVSRSGMSRSITPFIMIGNEPRYIAYSVAVLFNQSRDKYDGIRVSGCGMDIGFHLVYNLSYLLYPEGFSTIGKSPTGKHTGQFATREAYHDAIVNGWTFRIGRNGDTSGWDDDGGYALSQRWI